MPPLGSESILDHDITSRAGLTKLVRRRDAQYLLLCTGVLKTNHATFLVYRRQVLACPSHDGTAFHGCRPCLTTLSTKERLRNCTPLPMQQSCKGSECLGSTTVKDRVAASNERTRSVTFSTSTQARSDGSGLRLWHEPLKGAPLPDEPNAWHNFVCIVETEGMCCRIPKSPPPFWWFEVDPLR